MIRCPITSETSLIFKNDKEKHNLKIHLGEKKFSWELPSWSSG